MAAVVIVLRLLVLAVESLDLVVVPIPTTMYSFSLLLSTAAVLSHQVDGIGIIVTVVVPWRKEVFVRVGYDS